MYTPATSVLFAGLASLLSVRAAPAADWENRWYQPRDSSVSALFEKRQSNPSDPSEHSFSPSENPSAVLMLFLVDFASNYPAPWGVPPADRIPKAWTDKLASIQLPDVPVSNPNNGYPTYSNGQGSDPNICSFTYECTADDDLHTPPDGIWAVGRPSSQVSSMHRADPP